MAFKGSVKTRFPSVATRPNNAVASLAKTGGAEQAQ